MQRLRDFARLVSPGGFLLALASFVLASKLAFLLGPFAFLPVVLPLFAAFPRNGRRRALAILMAAAFSLGAALNVLQSRGEEGQGTYAGLVIDARDSYFVLETLNGRYLVYEESSTRERFDVVKVEGLSSVLEMAHYESRFSFEEYLNKKGVYHEIEGAEVTSLFAFPFRLRERGLDFLAHFEEETSHLIDSLLFGRSDSSSSTIALYEAAGALFYLSGSGTLLAAFLRAFEYVVRLRLDEKKSAAITLGLSLALSFLYPFKVGIARVVLTKGVRLGLLLKERKVSSLVPPLVSASVLLLFDFRLALDDGFFLGYLISFSFALSSFVRHAGWKRRGLYGSLVSLSIIFPILASGGNFHLLSPLYSLVLAPMVYPFHFLSLVSFLTVPFARVLDAYAAFLGEAGRFLSKIDLAIPIVGDPNVNEPIYYLFLFLSFLFIEIGARLFLKGTLIAGVALAAVNYVPFAGMVFTKVIFIDVGQGDAILLSDGLRNVLVDTGGNISFDTASEVLIPYFRKERIYRLDALIVTHDDLDHAGAVDSLCQAFPVGEVISGPESFPYDFGGSKIANLNPVAANSKEENDSSLVLSFELCGASFLLMGDASKAVERRLVENGIGHHDVLKVGHHGSDTSSSYEFLEAVSPRLAVISCGEGNRYGHPDAEVVSRLRSLEIPCRRTDFEGTIELVGTKFTGFAL